MDETGVKMSAMLDDGASTASIPSPTHWYDDPQRALGAELVEILTRTPFVLVLAYYVGKAFAKARLPRISGYLVTGVVCCLLYTSPSPRDATLSRMPSSA